MVLVYGLGLAAGCEPTGSKPDKPGGLQSVRQALVGPGLGNIDWAAEGVAQWSKVGQIIDGTGDASGHGNVAMVNGYLATIYTTDGGGANASFAFWNVSNPRSPVRAYNYPTPSNSKLREPHGFGFTNGYSNKTYFVGQSTTGFQIWDWSNPAAATLVKDVVLPDVNGSDYGGVWWTHLQAPYVFVAGGTAGLFVVDISNPTSPSIPKRLSNTDLGITRINQVQVIGNLMVVNYSENGSGSSLLDISDPVNPRVTFTDNNNPPVPYSTLFNGGRLYSAGKQSQKLGAFTIQFDSNKHPSGMVRYGVDTGSGLGGGGYLSVQDGFVFGGFSTKWAKFDARTLPMTQVGSATPPVPYNGDVDFGTVIGNLVMAGNDHGDGSALMVHQTARDTTGPTVNFVNPLDNSVNRNVKSRVGLTFSEAVELETLNNTNIQVRPVGGAALAGKFSTQAGVVNFSPSAPLAANTTYEVVVVAGGVKDWVGNPVPTGFISRFSTGASIISEPTQCALGNDVPGNVGTAVAFTATGCSGTGTLQYSWNFGDGSAPTAFSTSPNASRTYTAAGHFNVILTVKDGANDTTTWNRRQTVIYPLTANKPTRSSTIVHDSSRNRVSVVNSDGNTVASLSSASPYAKVWETAVGKNPRALAQPAPGGDLWVTNQDDATLTVLDGGTGALKYTVSLPRASRPHGIAFNPAGSTAYVALEATGQLIKLDAATRTITGTVAVGPKPRGLAVSHDGARIFVTRLVSSPDIGGEVREVSASAFTVTRTFVLPEDTTTAATEADGPGLPNYVQALTITPDGRGAWVPSKKDNIRRGIGPGSIGEPFGHDSRLRTIVSKLDLVGNTVDTSKRKDLNDSDMANAVELTPNGDFAFIALQGNNRIDIHDALSHNAMASITGTGLAPRGLVLVGTKLFVQSFMSRDVTVFDVSSVGGTNNFPKLATVSTQATELLSAQVLQGKRIFYNAADPRMSNQGYTSCASCHLDGDSDGQLWDFTQAGEGFRATSSLLGRGGVSEQGRVHWTGNFDEIQDFENDMRSPGFGGTGFLNATDWAATSQTLGTPKAGKNADLDALAAYVTSLRTVPASPFRNADGTMTADALAGKALFESPAVGCATCHSGAELTDSGSSVRHDVGTISTAAGRASGQRLGGPLDGFDTPSLLGVWASGPYLHNHSAATLMDVITTSNPNDRHGVTSQLTTTEKNQLVAYMQQLDDTPATPPPAPAWSHEDVGAVAAAGSWSESGGTHTVTGSGADIFNAADEFHFVHQTLTGDGEIRARVNSMGNTHAFSKAGVMIRAGLATGAIHAAMLVTPTSANGYRFQWRPSVDFTMTSTGNQIRSTLNGTAPQYVRLVKSGNSYTAYHSANGSTWTQVGTTQTLSMGASFQVGLALSSHADGTLNTATFDNVTLTGWTSSGPPAAPTNLAAAAGNRQVTLSWTASSGATSYTVKRSNVAGGPYTALTPNTTTTSFTDSTVTNGTSYFYVVSATNAAGDSGNSGQQSAMPSLPAPAGLAATATSSQVSLTWNAVSNATGYVVKRSTTSGGPYTPLTPNPTTTSFTDSTVASGLTYYYVVSATSTGHEGLSSAQVSAALPTPPAAPTNLAATAGNRQVALSWTAASGATSYTVKRSLDVEGPYTALTPNPTTTSFTDSTVTNGTSYFYVVSANNAVGGGDDSNWVSATPSLPAPTGLTATAGNAQVSLSWNAVTNATGYVVKRGTTSGGPYTVQGSPAATGFTDNTVTNGTTYYYLVTATSTAHEGPSSAQVSATPTAVVAPAAPSNLAATVTGGNQATLTWTDNSSNETGFRIERKVGAGSYATLTSKAAGSTSHADTGLTVNTYTYRVIATGTPDSAASNEVVVIISNPAADAYVRSGTYATTNFGTATVIDVKSTATTTTRRNGFLRFSLSGVAATVTSAKLRLYGNASVNPKATSVYSVADITWSETTITWNTPTTDAGGPAMSATALDTQTMAITAAYVEWDVTAYVQQRRTAGATAVSLGVKSGVLSDDGQTTFNSREGVNKPMLIISSRP